MNEGALIALSLLFAGVCYGAWRKWEAVSNLQAAWPYRCELARLAYAVEHNRDAPEEAKLLVSFLADRAFDDGFARQLAAEIRAGRAQAGKPQSLLRVLQNEYGEQTGILVHKAILAYAVIVFHMDSAMLRWLRRRTQPPASMLNMRRKQMWSVWDVAQRMWQKQEGCAALR